MIKNTHSRSPRNQEVHTNGETFIDQMQIRNLLLQFLSETGRIDDSGVVQPLEIERYGEPEKYLWGGTKLEPIMCQDIFFPTEEMRRPCIVTNRNGVKSRNVIMLMDVLYSILSGQSPLELTEPEVDYIRHSKAALEDTLAMSSTYRGFINDGQICEAFHIQKQVKAVSDFDVTRIYVTGEKHGAPIMQRMILEGADFASGKVWVPYETTHRQTFRYDTPIFEMNTFSQLRSVLSHLRDLSRRGFLSGGPVFEPLVGQPIPGLPGAYLGQAKEGESFNGNMEHVFKSALSDACSEIHLRAGDTLTEYHVDTIVRRVVELAQQNAIKIGIDPNNHAFYTGQPINKIMSIVNNTSL